MKRIMILLFLISPVLCKGQQYVEFESDIPSNDANNAQGKVAAIWRNHTIAPTVSNNFPNNQNWWTILQTQYADTRYDAQLAFGLNQQDLWLRFNYNDNWQPWKKIVLENSIGNVGIGIKDPKAQLVIGDDFGASISGSGGGNGVFGSNLAVYQGGSNHNKLYTPATHTSNYGFSGMDCSWGLIKFYTKAGNTVAGDLVTIDPSMTIKQDGNVLIGKTTQQNSAYKLDVGGSIRANEIKVNLDGADFVFEPNYKLRSLNEVETYIRTNKHLPGIESADRMEADGTDLGALNTKLLQKVEELTLYIIKQNKKITKLEKQSDELQLLKKRIEALESASKREN